ncbi:MAG TPA: Spy/CpxP family protein refolding chaperone [Pyrinomonadaceae bacterium]|nr:Spy/CpxP family protein refolding chaperone [Pyrinomonadaceae bacterium]
MRNKLLAMAGIAVLVIGATVLALGHTRMQGPGHGHGDGGQRRGPGFGPEMLEHMTKALNLTSDQQAQIKTLFEGIHAAQEPRHARLHELHKQMEAATANGQFDEAKVRAIANEQAQLMADSMVEHERIKSKIYGILTAEQRAKAEEMHKRGGPHERRPGPPPPPPGE